MLACCAARGTLQQREREDTRVSPAQVELAGGKQAAGSTSELIKRGAALRRRTGVTQSAASDAPENRGSANRRSDGESSPSGS